MANKKVLGAKKGVAITDDDIDKAFAELSEDAELIEKAESEEDLEENEELEKADGDEDEEGNDEEDVDDEEEDEDDDDDIEDSDDEDDEDEDEDEGEKEKAVEVDEFKAKKEKKKPSEDIQKAIEVSPFLKAVVDEIKDSQQETRTVLGNVATLLKAVTDQLQEMDSLLSEPRVAKSRLGKGNIAKRFNKGVDDEFEKGDEGSEVSIRDKKQIINILDGLSFEDGSIKDAEFAKALASFEATGNIAPAVKKRIEERTKLHLVA